MAHCGTDASGNEDLLVVCLCAAWCDACSEFRDTFDKLAQSHQGAHFVWLDVEDDSALIGDVEIENFPTLAVFRGETPLFYGVTMPQEGVVARTLAHLSREHGNPVAVPEEIVGLPGALSSRL
jgi:thioredoxin-like negative regulator of GroEL